MFSPKRCVFLSNLAVKVKVVRQKKKNVLVWAAGLDVCAGLAGWAAAVDLTPFLHNSASGHLNSAEISSIREKS